MKLKVLSGSFGIARLPAESDIPSWAKRHRGFLSMTSTEDELSIVCEQSLLPVDTSFAIKPERDRRILKVEGPLDFSLTGILSSLLQPIAEAEISVFTVSTFDTDYILVHDQHLNQVVTLLQDAGHLVEAEQISSRSE